MFSSIRSLFDGGIFAGFIKPATEILYWRPSTAAFHSDYGYTVHGHTGFYDPPPGPPEVCTLYFGRNSKTPTANRP